MHDIQKQIEILIRDKYAGVAPAQELLTADITRLMDGEPIDYVIGWKPFLGVKIDLSYKPLIPRVETEYWVDVALEYLKKNFNTKDPCLPAGRLVTSEDDKKINIRVLDLFCGSGCIGLSALSRLSNTHVTFADIDARMGEQVARSGALNAINSSRFSLVTSDIFSNILGVYDVVFANPPYVPRSRKNDLDISVTEFEPHTALFAGEDGLDVIFRFLHRLPRHLAPGGVCFLEYDTGQEAAIAEYIKKETPFGVEFFKDQYGKFRWGILKYSH